MCEEEKNKINSLNKQPVEYNPNLIQVINDFSTQINNAFSIIQKAGEHIFGGVTRLFYDPEFQNEARKIINEIFIGLEYVEFCEENILLLKDYGWFLPFSILEQSFIDSVKFPLEIALILKEDVVTKEQVDNKFINYYCNYLGLTNFS